MVVRWKASRRVLVSFRSRDKGNCGETVKEIMSENFQNLKKNPQQFLRLKQYIKNRGERKKSTPRYIVMKWQDIKHEETILKATREKTSGL